MPSEATSVQTTAVALTITPTALPLPTKPMNTHELHLQADVDWTWQGRVTDNPFTVLAGTIYVLPVTLGATEEHAKVEVLIAAPGGTGTLTVAYLGSKRPEAFTRPAI